MDEQKFSELAFEMRGRLYRTAFLYLGSEQEALGTVDEAVYKGLLAYKKLKHPEFFSTWMTRILINECKNALKRRKRFVSLDELPETAAPEDYDSLPLKAAIARLPQNLRAVIVLRYFTGLTTKETAKALEIPQGTAATRLKKALGLLRLELSDEKEAAI